MSDFTKGALSRVVPTHRKTVAFSWIKHDFMPFETYRKARERRLGWHGMKIERACFWCKSPFKDEDMLALAHMTKGGANKLLCQQCASDAALALSRGGGT